ncbi:MAG: hypothetical protein WDW36_003785 [Sanguina aurantia]
MGLETAGEVAGNASWGGGGCEKFRTGNGWEPVRLCGGVQADGSFLPAVTGTHHQRTADGSSTPAASPPGLTPLTYKAGMNAAAATTAAHRYFQTQELFLVQDTVLQPLLLPSRLLRGHTLSWRSLYFGTSTSSITRDMSGSEVSHLFNHAAMCVRSFCYTTAGDSSTVIQAVPKRAKLPKVTPASEKYP